jgi:hypothetical protein
MDSFRGGRLLGAATTVMSWVLSSIRRCYPIATQLGNTGRDGAGRARELENFFADFIELSGTVGNGQGRTSPNLQTVA